MVCRSSYPSQSVDGHLGVGILPGNLNPAPVLLTVTRLPLTRTSKRLPLTGDPTPPVSTSSRLTSVHVIPPNPGL